MMEVWAASSCSTRDLLPALSASFIARRYARWTLSESAPGFSPSTCDSKPSGYHGAWFRMHQLYLTCSRLRNTLTLQNYKKLNLLCALEYECTAGRKTALWLSRWWYMDSMHRHAFGQWGQGNTEEPPPVFLLPQTPLGLHSHASAGTVTTTR